MRGGYAANSPAWRELRIGRCARARAVIPVSAFGTPTTSRKIALYMSCALIFEDASVKAAVDAPESRSLRGRSRAPNELDDGRSIGLWRGRSWKIPVSHHDRAARFRATASSWRRNSAANAGRMPRTDQWRPGASSCAFESPRRLNRKALRKLIALGMSSSLYESARLEALAHLGALDSPPESDFDDVVALVAATLEHRTG